MVMQQQRRHKEKADMPKNLAQETGIYEYEQDIIPEEKERRIYAVTCGLWSTIALHCGCIQSSFQSFFSSRQPALGISRS